MKVKVDQDVCIGCGLCTGIAPDIFRLNEEGKAESFSEVSEAQKDSVQEAIDSCPVSAISWEE